MEDMVRVALHPLTLFFQRQEVPFPKRILGFSFKVRKQRIGCPGLLMHVPSHKLVTAQEAAISVVSVACSLSANGGRSQAG